MGYSKMAIAARNMNALKRLKPAPSKRVCSKMMRTYVLHHLSRFTPRGPSNVRMRLLNDYGYISEKSVCVCLRELEREGLVLADRSEASPAFWGYRRHKSQRGAL